MFVLLKHPHLCQTLEGFWKAKKSSNLLCPACNTSKVNELLRSWCQGEGQQEGVVLYVDVQQILP